MHWLFILISFPPGAYTECDFGTIIVSKKKVVQKWLQLIFLQFLGGSPFTANITVPDTPASLRERFNCIKRNMEELQGQLTEMHI